MKKFIGGMIAVLCSVVSPILSDAKTLMLEGRLHSSIAMRQQMEFSVDKGEVNSLTFRFALPAEFAGKSVSQSIDSFSVRFHPQPSTSTVERDTFGNSFQKVSWNNVNDTIRVNMGYTASVRSQLSAMESLTPFPIGTVSSADAVYLKPTELTQSDAPAIAALARALTGNAKNEYEAVTAITNHVTDSVKYTFNPPRYDALYTLETRSGNCQNFAHLSIALLRSVGIPARIVGGITLKDPWKVPIDSKNSIVQSMGQGGHAWMEIYFPDLGWLPYDPQQSRQFTSSRHIKQTHGLDSRDINDSWRGSPYLPRYSESIDGTLNVDDIQLKVKKSGKDPRPYIISNLFAAKASAMAGAEPDKQEAASAAAKKERERLAREKLEKENAGREKVERERLARLKAEQEKAEQQRLADELLKKKRLEQERHEAEQVARLKLEEERKAKERAEKERLAKERSEAERLMRLKAEEEQRQAAELAERARLAAEKAEAERVARYKAEQERKNREQAKRERIAGEKFEAERLAAEQKRLAAEKAEKERIASLKQEEERLLREKQEKERVEKQRIDVADVHRPSGPLPGTQLTFGNMEFPNLVENFSVRGDTGTRILDKETTEYVTSRHIFAQAITVHTPFILDTISLAMRKFGGDGTIYIDLVKDDDSKPNILEGIRSNMLPLDTISRKPGYYWVDFSFPSDLQRRIEPGKYWIVLRYSGDAIMNWFYIPGKPYGDSDDTRSTAKGFQWEDILNYDFVFKVTGTTI